MVETIADNGGSSGTASEAPQVDSESVLEGWTLRGRREDQFLLKNQLLGTPDFRAEELDKQRSPFTSRFRATVPHRPHAALPSSVVYSSLQHCA
jgi:hypothetical protein